MRGVIWSCVAVQVVTIIPVAMRAQSTPIPSVDSIVAHNVTVRGGSAALAAVRTARLYGTITFGDETQAFRVEIARPDRIRTQIGVSNPVIVQAYDGHTGWMIDPNHRTPTRLPDEVTRNVAAGGDLDGPLIDYATKGSHIVGVMLDTAQGRPAYRIGVHTAAGLDDAYYIDVASWLQTKWEGKRTVSGHPVVYESIFRDYRPAGGALFAYEVDSRTRGEPGGQQIRLDSVRVNAPVNDADFAPPAPLASNLSTPRLDATRPTPARASRAGSP